MKLLAAHQGGGLGGAPVSLLKLLRALDQGEFTSRAIFTEPGQAVALAHALDLRADVVPTGGAFFYSAHARLGVRSVARFIRTFPGAVRLARAVLRQNRPDLVHLNTSVLLAWAAAARRERLPVVWVVREVLGPNPWLRRWHANFILRHARRVVATSNAVSACFPCPIERVYNAVDLADFQLDVLHEARFARAEIGLSAEANVMVVVGSVQRPKGHWLVLEALQHLPDVELVLVTGGVAASYASTWKGRLKQAVGAPLDNLEAFLRDAGRRGLSRRIHVTGFTPNVAKYIAAADVLVFPSLAPEGFGRPIIEAMALRRPVVATDVGPSRELLGADAGVLVPPDPRVLADTVSKLLSRPDLREHMGQAGRARVEQCFSLERQVGEMASVYRRALAE